MGFYISVHGGGMQTFKESGPGVWCAVRPATAASELVDPCESEGELLCTRERDTLDSFRACLPYWCGAVC